MIKYRLTALALKAFSSSAPARKLYRAMGNRLGGARRMKFMPPHYLQRAAQNVAFCRTYAPLEAGDCVVELGTGWVHWEALTLRLFFEFEAVLYDVWDNRQFGALKVWVRRLESHFGENGLFAGEDLDRARWLIKKIDAAANLADVYKLLGFRYVLDAGGLMELLPRGVFRLAISRGVMEHISASAAPQFVSNMASLLVDGGIGIHGINISDHLAHYDPSAHPKQYLAYSDQHWRFWYENGVQYINRIQRGDWLRMFANADFSVVDEIREEADTSGLRVNPQFRSLDREDVGCTTLLLVVRKGVHAVKHGFAYGGDRGAVA